MPDDPQGGRAGTGRVRIPARVRSAGAGSWSGSVLALVGDGDVRRRATDLTRVVASVLALAALAAWASRTGRLETTTYDLLLQVPSSVKGLFRTVATGTLAAGVGLGLLALVVGRWRLTASMFLAAGVAAAVAWGARRPIDIVDRRARAGLVAADGSVPDFPALYLAVGVALLLAALPFLTRPVQRVVGVVVPAAVVGTVYLLDGLPTDALAAVVVGWGAAAAAHLAFGTPAGTPTLESVARALEDLGVAAGEVVRDPDQQWGAVRYRARADDGAPLRVEVIGRDATDAQILTSLWRWVWYKDVGPTWMLQRVQRIEHEAYLLLLAERAGLPAPTLVAAGVVGARDDAVLVARTVAGPSLAEEAGADRPADPAAPAALWALLADLHAAGLVHGDVCLEHLARDADGTVHLTDLHRATVGDDPARRRLDRLGMLVATARLAGPAAAAAAAHDHLGDEGLAELVPLLQPAALAAATRFRPPGAKALLAELREAAVERTGGEPPEVVELRRVAPTDLAMAAATIVGVYLLAQQLSSVDGLWSTLVAADPAWWVAVVLCSQAPQFTSAVTVTGAVAAPLPFGRVVLLQYASGFTGLVGGTVANTALVIRFFQRQGLAPAVAVGSGMLWGVAGFIAQVTLSLACVVVAGLDTRKIDLDTGDGSGPPWLLYLLVVGTLVGVALAVPRVRRLVIDKARPQVDQVLVNLREVGRSPGKALRLFGGAFGSQVFFALSLMAAVHAYGGEVGFAAVVLTNSLASLFGGLAPIPGGMGVTEAGMITGLTIAGVPQETAVAATLLHRTFTFYLPPTWGWLALRTLRARDAV